MMSTCTEDFVAHVKDHNPSTVPSLIGIAASYSDARPNKHNAKPPVSKVSFAASSTGTQIKLFGRPVSLLQNTGCYTVAINFSLVPEACVTIRVMRVNTFCIVSNPVTDIILGNIKGIKAASDSSISCVVTGNIADNSSQISLSPEVKLMSVDDRLTEQSISSCY
ncbi:hypothetical protein ElyMa_002956700 [Elysia marginata]|uniref:Uncharacterized protein n=1 Tax=Elysia marginata TaxID=1093978 RepID=A0AAV4I750_9GAST|nr:hypothetical protein ElyMa_002956700 [Elysia marginata]